MTSITSRKRPSSCWKVIYRSIARYIDISILVSGDAPGISKLALTLSLFPLDPQAEHGCVVDDTMATGVHTIDGELIVIELGARIVPCPQAHGGQALGIIELDLQANEKEQMACCSFVHSPGVQKSRENQRRWRYIAGPPQTNKPDQQ